jgi:hypothetical protein
VTRSPAALATALAWLPTARTLPRAAPLALACAAIGLIGLTFASRLPQEPADPFSVRLALLLTALMVVWAFEDRAGATLDPTPVGRARLRVVRAATSVTLWAGALAIVLVMAGAEHASGRYTLEAATIMTWALAMSAAAARAGEADSGRVAVGMILALIKWNPDAIWGVAEDLMATKGFVTRIGYAHMERGFFEWEWLPNGAEAREWLALSERADLEYLIEERAARLA